MAVVMGAVPPLLPAWSTVAQLASSSSSRGGSGHGGQEAGRRTGGFFKKHAGH